MYSYFLNSQVFTRKKWHLFEIWVQTLFRFSIKYSKSKHSCLIYAVGFVRACVATHTNDKTNKETKRKNCFLPSIYI